MPEMPVTVERNKPVTHYTPTTKRVREAYVRAMRNAFIASTGEHEAEFDRWLAHHDQEMLETVLSPSRHILSSGYGCGDCAYEDLRQIAGMEPLGSHSEHI